MAHSYKTILKKIILKLGFGFKKDRIEACLGEEIPLQLDEKLFEGNVKNSRKRKDKNSFARWLKEDGSELTDTKTIQDDNGTTHTRSDETSYLMHQVENLSNKSFFDAVYEAVVQSLGGNPIYRLIRRGKQVWTLYSEKADNSFRISGVNEQDPTQKGDFYRINRKGNVSRPFQYRSIAILESDTENVTGDGTVYQHGSAKSLNVLKDQGNQFFGGNGAGSPATYTVLEDNTYLCYMHITFNSTGDKPAELINRIITSSGRTYVGRGFIAGGIGNSSVTLLVGIDAVAGDVFTFLTVAFASPSTKVISFSGTAFPTITTYIGVYCLG